MYRAKPSTQARRQGAAYLLRVLYQGRPANPAGIPGLKHGIFRLPLAPQNVRYEAQARTQALALVHGMEADEHGMNPPTITISGTFGEATRGGLDGFEWQRALETLITWYSRSNLDSGLARRPLHVLEWHDTLRGEHWVVTPKAVPYGEQDAGKPVTEQYTLRLDAQTRADTVSGQTRARAAAPTALSTDAATLCPHYPGCAQSGPAEPHCPFRGQA